MLLDMTPRMFDVLQMLVNRAGELVTKDEILGTIWNGNFVEEGNLTVHICRLRALLGGSKGERYIETEYGSGYRFVCRTVEIAENEYFDGLYCNPEISIESSNTAYAQQIVRRIRIANKYVVIRIDVEDVKEQRENNAHTHRERERFSPTVGMITSKHVPPGLSR